MRSRLFEKTASFVVLPALFLTMGLIGCSTASTAPISDPTTSLSKNWQIQTGSSIGTPQGSSFFLAGAMQIQGSQVTAKFHSIGTCLGPSEPLAYTGTYNAATGALSLNSTPPAVSVQLAVPSDPTSLATGSLGGGGVTCQAVAQGIPSVGIEISALSGAFSGAVASANSTGTATLTVSQAAMASADSTFPLTGTLQFSNTTCTNTFAVTGSVNGAGYSLASAASGSPAVSSVAISGYDNAGGSTLPSVSIAFADGPCVTGPSSAATYTGNLTL